MACFWLFAFPVLPLFCVPSLVLWTAFFTSFFAAEPYFAISLPFPGYSMFAFASLVASPAATTQ